MNRNANKEVVQYSDTSEVINDYNRKQETKSNTLVDTYEQRAEIFNVNKERIKRLKKEYKQLRSKAKGGKTPEAKSALSIVYNDIDRIVKKIEAIEKHFNKLRKLDHVDFSVYAKELKDYQNNLESGEVDQAIQEASLGKKVSIWRPIHSPADAKDALVKDAEVAKDNLNKSALLTSIVALSLSNDTSSKIQSFINGAMSDSDKIAFIRDNGDALKELERTNVAVYNELIHGTGLDIIMQQQCQAKLYPAHAGPQRRGKEYGSRDEALAHNGLYGLIDYASKGVQMDDPKSQKFYQNAGNLALTVGGVFLGFKAIQTLWYKCFGSEEKKNSANRWWVLAPAGVLLATGGNPKQIFTGGPFMEKVMSLFSGDKSAEKTAVLTGGGATTSALNLAKTPAEKEKAEKAKLVHSTAVPATIAIFSGNTYKDLEGMVEKKDDKYVIKADQYDALLADLKAKQQQDQQDHNLEPKERVALEQKITYLKTIGKDDEQNLIHQGMVEMGLDKKLEGNKDNVAKDAVENDITNYIGSLIALGDVEFEKISDDPKKQQMFVDYRSSNGKKPTLKDLQEAGVFILKIEDTSHTKAQIDELWLSDADAYIVQKTCNEIFTTYLWETQATGIQLEKDADNKIIFKSYGQPIKLDLTHKTIDGLTQKGGETITFKNLGETLRVANLINAIKQHSLNMTEAPNTDRQIAHPFYVDTIGNVMFRGVGKNTTALNGAKGREVLFGFGLTGKAGTTNTLDDISSTMNSRERKEDLTRYLNEQNPPFRRTVPIVPAQ